MIRFHVLLYKGYHENRPAVNNKKKTVQQENKESTESTLYTAGTDELTWQQGPCVCSSGTRGRPCRQRSGPPCRSAVAASSFFPYLHRDSERY
jgi:hypothetical protein